jgi:CubicO group peptidase (beta-lactamase class C family)
MKNIRVTLFAIRLLKTIIACIFFSAGSSFAGQVPDVTNPAVVEAFVDGAVKSTMKKHHSPSGVVAVMKDGELVFSKGYGFIDVEKRIPVDPATSLFRPGSISKLFTWVSVMQLVEKGKLDLNIDVNQYLRTFKVKDTWPGQPVTLRDIMTHTAGFEDGGIGYLIIDDPDRIIPLAEALAKYQPERVNPPGLHSAYSNWATALAGLIVSNVSGDDFNQYVQKNIFDVLGMTGSSFVEPLPPKLNANMAKAYKYQADKYVEINYEIISNFGPAGALATTAADMTLFARAILGDGEHKGARILKAETLQQMTNEGFAHDARIRGMGLGFIKRQFGPDGFDNFGHDGGTTVFISHFGLSRSEGFMLYSSFSGPGAGATHRALVQPFYDEFFPREVPTIEPPSDFGDRAQKYAGKYNAWRSSFNGIEAIIRPLTSINVVPMPDNTLMIGASRYVEVDKNLFRGVDSYDQFSFQEDENGNITDLVQDGLGVNQYFRAPFYETMSFTNIMIGLSLVVFLGVFLRLGYQWRTFRTLTGPEKSAQRASIAVATLNILFLIILGITVSGGIQPLMYEIPVLFKVGLILPLLGLIATGHQLYMTVQIWRAGLLAGTGARIRYSIVCAAGLFFVWFYYYWNLLGFNYYN